MQLEGGACMPLLIIPLACLLILSRTVSANGWCENHRIDFSPWDSTHCGIENSTNAARCWKPSNRSPNSSVTEWLTITNYCGIEMGTFGLHCDLNPLERESVSPDDPFSNPYLRRWKSVSSSVDLERLACAIDWDDEIYCSQFDAPSGQKWMMVDVTPNGGGACGIDRDTYQIHCWGRSKLSNLEPAGKQWVYVSTQPQYACGIEKGSGAVHCWSSSRDIRDALTAVPSNVTSWDDVQAFKRIACGIASDTKAIHCWGADYGLNEFGDVPQADGGFAKISTRDATVCALEIQGGMQCTGRGFDDDDWYLQPNDLAPGYISRHSFCQPTAIDWDSVTADQYATILDMTESSISDWPDRSYSEVPVLNGWSSLKQIQLPSSLQFIGSRMAAGSKSMQRIDMSSCDQLTTIPSHALGTDKGTLTEIQLPSSLTTIEAEAFTTTDGVQQAGVEVLDLSGTQLASVVDGSFRGLHGVTRLSMPSTLATIPASTFGGMDGLRGIDMSSCDQLTTIPSHALGTDKGTLTEIQLPSSLTTIEVEAFTTTDGVQQSGVEVLDLSGTQLASVVDGSFRGLHGVTRLSMPSTLATIPASTFGGMDGLRGIDMSSCDQLTTIPSHALGTDKGTLTEIQLPSSLTTIEVEAFTTTDGVQQSGVEVLDLSGTQLASVVDGSFRGLHGVTRLSMPSTLATIPASTFGGMDGLRGIDMSSCDQLTTIPSHALGTDKGTLTEIQLPSSLTTIEVEAFTTTDGVQQSGVEVLDLSGTQLASVVDGSFRGLHGVTRLSMPSTLATFPASTFGGMDGLLGIDMSPCDQLTTIPSHALGTDKGTLTEIQLPSSLTTIEAEAFTTTDGVQQAGVEVLDLSGTQLASVVDGSFRGLHGVTRLSIPSTLATIPASTFGGMDGLRGIDMSSCDQLTTIPSHALGTDKGTLTEIQLPSSLTTIEVEAFTTTDGVQQSGVEVLDLSGTQLASVVDGSFRGLHGVTRLSMPSTLATIPASTFGGMDGLRGIDMSSCDQLTTIPSHALVTDKGTLTEIQLPSSLTTIEVEAFTTTDGVQQAGVEVLDLSGTQLASVVDGSFRGLHGVTRLSMPSTLATFPASTFGGMDGLRGIDMSSCDQLTTIPSHALGTDKGTLTEIQLPSSLTTIEAEAFTTTDGVQQSGVEVLDLSGTQLASVVDGSFRGLHGVTRLSMPSTLATIPASTFGGMDGLRGIDMSSCDQLTTIPSHALGTDKGTLTEIQLPSSLTTIEAEAFTTTDGVQQAGVEVLDLSGTQLASVVDGSFRGLHGVTRLSMPSTLATIPASTFSGAFGAAGALTIDARGVRSLHADSFQGIAGAPSALTINVPALETGETGTFRSLSDLQRLELTVSSSFAASSDTSCGFFRGLTALQSLVIHGNGAANVFGQLQDLANDGFAGCDFKSSIRELHLHGLDLRQLALTQDTFSSLTGLEKLTVSGSSGDMGFSIEDDVLTPLVSLQQLDLSGNGIEELPPLTSTPSSILVRINLESNSLTYVHEGAFDKLLGLVQVDVDTVGVCTQGASRGVVQLSGGPGPAMCIECQLGQYCEDGLLQAPCPRGTYNPQYRATSLDACRQCPEGTTTSVPGSSGPEDCITITVSCPAGTAGQECDKCQPGTASMGGNILQCITCKEGTVSRSNTGSQVCVDCPAGTHMPLQGRSLVSSCIACPEGLRSDGGSSMCSGCPGGTFLDSDTGTCVDPPVECDADGAVCLPGVPEPVPAPTIVVAQVLQLPLPSGVDDAPIPTAGAPTETSVTETRRLRVGGVDLSLEEAVVSARMGGSVGRRLQEAEGGSGNQEDEEDEEGNSILETMAWVVASFIIALVLVLLLVPSTRPILHSGLRIVDNMASAHSPTEYSAIRKVTTASGGWFTVAAFLVALASSSSLLVQFAFRNSVTTDGLRVATQGVPGASRAAAARTDVVLDVAVPKTSLVGCPDALQLSVSQGRLFVASGEGQTAPPHSLSGLAVDVQVEELEIAVEVSSSSSSASSSSSSSSSSSQQQSLCWMRATCADCGLQQATSLQVDAHWAAQVIGWRLATMDAEGAWSLESGVAVPPAGDPDVTNVTLHVNEMLGLRTEAIALVGHLLDDSTVRGSDPLQADGYRTQDTQTGATETRPVGSINPATSLTQLRIELQRSGVFATTQVVPALSPAQLASAISGLVVGILGGFTSAFALFEKFAGERMVWLCGPTGLVATQEEEELRRQREGELSAPVANTTRPKGIPGKVGAQSTKGAAPTGEIMPMQSPMWSEDERHCAKQKEGTEEGTKAGKREGQ